MEYPDQISITPEEADFKEAKSYTSSGYCLLATAFRRLGYIKVLVSSQDVCIQLLDDKWVDYLPSRGITPKDLCIENGSYNPELVGQTFIFTKAKK